MTDKERLLSGLAVSLFVHFLLFGLHAPLAALQPSGATVVELDLPSLGAFHAPQAGLGLGPSPPQAEEDAKAADRRRRAFLKYLDDLDDAVHARRLDAGDRGLLGVATYSFQALADGSFTAPVLCASSGDPRLDATARRAILAASGRVKRPAILGRAPIPVILQVKYQYELR